MSQFTTETQTPPREGVQRICTASTACPTVILGVDQTRAERLLAEHEHRDHGTPTPKTARARRR